MTAEVERTAIGPIDGLAEIALPCVDDERGGLDKFFDPDIAGHIGRSATWRQVLRSRTNEANTLRGLHCQLRPYSEAKLIAPLRGRMFWVCVDLRTQSKHFGQWRSHVLDATRPKALFAERGFGHGCLSLTDDVELLILADNDYAASSGVGIAWNDPDLAIEWPLLTERPKLSPEHEAFADFATFRRDHGGL